MRNNTGKVYTSRTAFNSALFRGAVTMGFSKEKKKDRGAHGFFKSDPSECGGTMFTSTKTQKSDRVRLCREIRSGRTIIVLFLKQLWNIK